MPIEPSNDVPIENDTAVIQVHNLNNVTILQALLDAGRYPATVYPSWLRIIVTYLVPIAVATTVPLQGLRGDLSNIQVWVCLGVGAASLAVALQVWKAGIQHYSGASS